MGQITGGMRASFLRDGFVVVPDVLDAAQIARGRRIVERMLERKPPDPEHRGPYFLVPRFGSAGHPLLEFYRSARIGELAGELLRPGLSVCEPEFAQLALTLPPWPNPPGGPHVDGLTPPEPNGRPGTFSLLAGVWLTDQTLPHRGNLWIWPGTHLRFGQFLAERGPAALRLQDMAPGPYPPVELGDPVQATGTAGSVLLAHYLLGHNIGDHIGGERRETVYYRLMAQGHREGWRDYVTDPHVEFRAERA
jgi:hypothetical protein